MRRDRLTVCCREVNLLASLCSAPSLGSVRSIPDTLLCTYLAEPCYIALCEPARFTLDCSYLCPVSLFQAIHQHPQACRFYADHLCSLIAAVRWFHCWFLHDSSGYISSTSVVCGPDVASSGFNLLHSSFQRRPPVALRRPPVADHRAQISSASPHGTSTSSGLFAPL